MDIDWYGQARCRERDVLFYPLENAREKQKANAAQTAHAKELCRVCPVRWTCLDYALTRPERYGIWGGFDPRERNQIRRDMTRMERKLGIVGGMRPTPPGIHRRAQGSERPALWYDIWYTIPGGDRSVLIGQTKRLERHLMHRAFPVSGARAQPVVGWVAAVTWLLQQWEATDRTSDYCHAVEGESVRIA